MPSFIAVVPPGQSSQPPSAALFHSGAAMRTSPHAVRDAAILTAATTVAAGAAVSGASGVKTYQANGTTSSGAGAATIKVQGSNNGANWDDIGTITLTLATTTSSDSFSSDDRYAELRGNVTAISGTGASVNLVMGY